MPYMKKEELIKELLKNNNLNKTKEELETLNREQLVEMLGPIQSVNGAELVKEESVTNNDETKKEEPLNKDAKPIPTNSFDPGWTDYVMTHFTEKEIFEGSPTCDGLRRVFQLLMGPILSCKMEVVDAPSPNNPSMCTVACHIDFHDKTQGFNRHITEVFNVTENNTPYPWHLAACATCATKAESRALRKAMNLTKIISREEKEGFADIDTNASGEEVGISDNTKQLITRLCIRCSINQENLFKFHNINNKLQTLTKEQAGLICPILQEYQKDPSKIPTAILNSNQDIIV